MFVMWKLINYGGILMGKKIIATVLAFALILTGLTIAPKAAKAEDKTSIYTLGQQVSGTITGEESTFYTLVSRSYSTDKYTFDVNKVMDVYVEVSAGKQALNWYLRSTGAGSNESGTVPAGTKQVSQKIVVKPGAYTFSITGSGSVTDENGTYTAKVFNTNEYACVFASPGGNIDGGVKKDIAFTYNSSYDYAKENFTIHNSNPKVAEVDYELNADGTGTVTLDPNKIGKTVVTIGINGGKPVTYTANVKSMVVFVSVGQSVKLVKPIGIKKPKWKSSKKAVATVKKGKIKAKKSGRATVTAKKGKTSFKYKIVVTDYIKLGKEACKFIKENVRNPEKFKVYTVYKGYDKNIVRDVKLPVVFIDYGYPNSYGAMERGKMICFYDDVHEIKSIAVDSYIDVMKKKKIPVKKVYKK